MTKRVSLQPCYVLHRRSYRDTSALLDVWSAEFGRVGLVARGVRRPRSRLQGLIQPFQPLLLSWSGRGELYTLAKAEACGSVFRLDGDLVFSGFYINELMIRLVHREDPHPGLYSVYENTLRALAVLSSTAYAGAQSREPSIMALDGLAFAEQRALRLFEKRLLEHIGYGLMLDRDAEKGAPVEKDRNYGYILDRGPVTQHGVALQPGVSVISGRSLLSLAREELNTEESLRDAKHLMRIALDTHLGGKPLQSRRLLITFKKQSRRFIGGDVGHH